MWESKQCKWNYKERDKGEDRGRDGWSVYEMILEKSILMTQKYTIEINGEGFLNTAALYKNRIKVEEKKKKN